MLSFSKMSQELITFVTSLRKGIVSLTFLACGAIAFPHNPATAEPLGKCHWIIPEETAHSNICVVKARGGNAAVRRSGAAVRRGGSVRRPRGGKGRV